MSRLARVLRLLLATFVSLLVLDESAKAVTFTVDSTANTADLTTDGICDSDPTADTDCSLRAAITEANATVAADTILFKHGSVSGGDPDDVAFDPNANPIGNPPTITQPLTVNAGNCVDDVDDPAEPCATTTGEWAIDSPGEVSIRGFAFLSATVAVHVLEAGGSNPAIPDFQLYGSWFGVDVNGAASTPVGTGVLLEDVDGARIGSGFVEDRNVFARHNAVGLDIEGADDTEVFRNTFGLLPDGSFARAGSTLNGDNIEITGSSAPSANPSTGTEIGASSAAAAATPECDGGCNVIAFAGVAGIDFSGVRSGIDMTHEPGEDEIPASGVDIVGNQIGPASQANVVAIAVGDADDVHIGGPAAADADRNTFGQNEVTSGAGAGNLLIQNNVWTSTDGASPPIAVSGSGAVLDNFLPIVNAQAGIRLSATSPPNFTVQGNVLGEQENGTVGGIFTSGIELLATASGNLIGGDGPGEGNVVVDGPGTSAIGIRIAGDDNQVLGNSLGVGATGAPRELAAGIQVHTDADGNAIGGDDAGEANLISNVEPVGPLEGNAIEVVDAASDGNVIGANEGTANAGMFIDLGGDGPGNLAEPNGPNGGAQAPAITTVSTSAIGGTAAAGADVRVFAKDSTGDGELGELLAITTADGAGVWNASLGLTPGTILAATATGAGGTSELSAPVTVPAPPPDGLGDTDPPETSLTKTPKKVVRARKKGKATYAFGSDEPGSTFTCTVDRKPASSCSSPLKLKKLKRGKHTFSVFATDGAGNVDPTPATHKFKVKSKKKR
ncbi:MAG: hypothetical protein H6533_10635 [Thermoleophilales bacterium]|nr:hypothetical protein [Thermoleophilales bacterium]